MNLSDLILSNTNILKGVREQEIVSRGALPREF